MDGSERKTKKVPSNKELVVNPVFFFLISMLSLDLGLEYLWSQSKASIRPYSISMILDPPSPYVPRHMCRMRTCIEDAFVFIHALSRQECPGSLFFVVVFCSRLRLLNKQLTNEREAKLRNVR